MRYPGRENAVVCASRRRWGALAECAIRYEGVSFSYKPGVPFMEGLSAAIPAGAVTSIVGPNGCGKSTLVKLAPAFCALWRGGGSGRATTR